MRLAAYRNLEKSIRAADAGSIRQRWEYGRLLLVEDDKTTAGGHLKNGVLAKLINTAAKSGIKISEREIRYRLECARTYPCESQIRQASAEFGYWWNLVAAGFPEYSKSDGELPFDPRTTDQLGRDAGRHNPLPDNGWEQRGLFESLDAETSTLADAERYAAEMATLTARYARKDQERAAYLAELIKAVDGDMSKTLAEAQEALEAR